MAAPSKSSQKAKNCLIAVLTLWSIVALVIIVVWSTSPDLKGASQCRSELTGVQTNLEGVKVMCSKDKLALEEKVVEERETIAERDTHIVLLLGQLNTTNNTLQQALGENLALSLNVSVLLETVEELRQREVNLTARIDLQEDHIEALQQNVSQATLLTAACVSLRAAADSQTEAAQSQTKACSANQEYQQKQLEKCKADVRQSKAPQQTGEKEKDPSCGAACLSVTVTMVIVCSAMHLLH